MPEGYVYILLNRAFQNDHYKIGMTTKTPEERAREISNATGVPRGFEVLYEQRVVDCQQAERLLHQRLHQYRSASNREFFQIPLKAAIKALENVADEIGRVESAEEPISNAIAEVSPAPPLGDINVGASRQPRKGGNRKSIATLTRGSDSRPAQTGTAWWASWNAKLEGVENSAVKDFVRAELERNQEARLGAYHQVIYRIADRRRFHLNCRSQYAYATQEGRFEGDLAYWQGVLSEPGDVRQISSNRVGFRLTTAADFAAFAKAMSHELANVKFSETADLDRPSDGE
jgi:hypothetical protein